MDSYQVYVGVDWGSETHVSVILDAEGKRLAERQVAHGGVGIGAWVEWLTGLASAEQIAVAIESPRGPVVEALLERGLHVYAINPKQLDRFRDRYTVSGAKDDRLDGFVLGDSLRTDLPLYRRIVPDAPEVIELRELSRLHDELTEELGRLSNRLREQLWRYYPQALTLCPAANEPWFWDILGEAPTSEQARLLTTRRVAKLLKARRIRRVQPDQIVSTLRSETLHVSVSTTRAVSGHVALLLPRLQLVHEQLQSVDKQIGALLEKLSEPPGPGSGATLSDVAIALSFPGLGQVVCASLFSEAAQPLEHRDLRGLRTVSGIAPVTRKTGKQRHWKRGRVYIRRACNPRLRAAMWHWARIYAQRDPVGKERYAELRAKGHSHSRALRGLGDRMLKVLVAMLRDGTTYDATIQPARQRG